MELNDRVITVLCSYAAARRIGKWPRLTNAESLAHVTVMVLMFPRWLIASMAFTASLVRPEEAEPFVWDLVQKDPKQAAEIGAAG